MEPAKDQRLWRVARKRANFRKSLYSFMVIILFLWAIWFINATSNGTGIRNAYPWPVWVTLGWGIALGFQYFSAYNGNREDMAEQEYEKLKKEQEL